MPSLRQFAPQSKGFRLAEEPDTLAELIREAEAIAARARRLLERKRFSDETETSIHALMYVSDTFAVNVSGSSDAMYE